ncbi:uncharacterized protein [Anabrus simplex]|uniref:uncharacterized protein n=1 Tax=Anabrus simplex TaxID=316456 RepID=UPI0035A33309
MQTDSSLYDSEDDEIDLEDEKEYQYHYGYNENSRDEQHDSTSITFFEGTAIVLAVAVVYCFVFHADETHFYVARMLAVFGRPEAQYVVGLRYMQGKGIRQNITVAMQWFKMAADQGHAYSSYNLAVGHLKGYRSGIRNKDAKRFLKNAIDQGLPEAKDAWEKIYGKRIRVSSRG